MEKLFYDAGVDLQFYAHEHSYERLLPVYNLTVNLLLFVLCIKPFIIWNAQVQDTNVFQVCGGKHSPYENPRAPVHIVTGSAVTWYTVF